MGKGGLTVRRAEADGESCPPRPVPSAGASPCTGAERGARGACRGPGLLVAPAQLSGRCSPPSAPRRPRVCGCSERSRGRSCSRASGFVSGRPGLQLPVGWSRLRLRAAVRSLLGLVYEVKSPRPGNCATLDRGHGLVTVGPCSRTWGWRSRGGLVTGAPPAGARRARRRKRGSGGDAAASRGLAGSRRGRWDLGVPGTRPRGGLHAAGPVRDVSVHLHVHACARVLTGVPACFCEHECEFMCAQVSGSVCECA